MRTVDFTGSVSWGTMREQDVLPAIMNVLVVHHPTAWEEIAGVVRDETGYRWDDLPDDHDFWSSGAMSGLINEDAWDAMNEIAPDDHYFGAHVGDGCDYGFWPIEFLD
jgi:hypothetical protein